MKGRFALAVVAFTAACSLSADAPTPPGDLQWPPENPRIRFVRAIALQRDIRGSESFLDRLAGRESPGLFVRPHGVAWGKGFLYVSDLGNGRIVAVPTKGATLETPSGLFTSPVGLAVCAEKLFVADSATGDVWLLDPDLSDPRRFLGGLERPTAVACGPAGEIVVAETGASRLVIVDPAGRRRTIGGRGSSEGEFNFPTCLAASPEGVWVGDTLNFRVQLVTWTGAVTRVFGANGDAPGMMPRIKGLALGAGQVLWMTDATMDLVSAYSASGEYLMSFGGTGPGPGQFAHPAGIAIAPDGTLAVADSLNRRVQLFSPVSPGQEIHAAN